MEFDFVSIMEINYFSNINLRGKNYQNKKWGIFPNWEERFFSRENFPLFILVFFETLLHITYSIQFNIDDVMQELCLEFLGLKPKGSG